MKMTLTEDEATELIAQYFGAQHGCVCHVEYEPENGEEGRCVFVIDLKLDQLFTGKGKVTK